MDRLTWWDDEGHIKVVRDLEAVVERLIQYEDLDMTPEEISSVLDAYGRGYTLKTYDSERLDIIKGIPTDKLREMVEAQNEEQIHCTCPFCGSSSVGVRWDIQGNECWALCFDCFARGPAASREKDAVKLWNKRDGG